MHFAWWSGTLLLALVNSSILMLCETSSPLNLEGLLIHVVAIQVCLNSGKEEIVSLDHGQVVEALVLKHLDVLICQVDSEVLLLKHLSKGRGDEYVYYKGSVH